MEFFSQQFNNTKDYTKNQNIKWSRDLINDFQNGKKSNFHKKMVTNYYYRPFIEKKYYYESIFSDVLTSNHLTFLNSKKDGNNIMISFSGLQSAKQFSILATTSIASLDFIEKTLCFPFYYYEKNKKLDNITDWALAEFQNYYKDKKITKEDIFHYVYAVLHNPVYREKYAIDLKQDYPRIPFYRDFKKWAAWGRELMDLHIGFEKTAPHKGITVIPAPADYRETKTHRLDYTKDEQGEKVFSGSLTFCDGSGLKDIPPRAFDYKLGNKSAIEWVLDQYIAPSWPTDAEVASGKRKIREDEKVLRDKFNTFKFADYREKVIDLIRRLATVSLQTLEIQGMMGEEK
jgi:predicted helicase